MHKKRPEIITKSGLLTRNGEQLKQSEEIILFHFKLFNGLRLDNDVTLIDRQIV